MGPFPKPARNADIATATTRNDKKFQGFKRNLLSVLLAGFALGATHTVVQAAATDQPLPASPEVERPVTWGGATLREDDAAKAIVQADPATPPEPKLDPNSVSFGSKSVPRPVVEAILRAAEATGVDPVYMMALADKESSFDTDVKSRASSAQGLFQFLTGTWVEMIRDFGARHGFVEEAAAIEGHGKARIRDAKMQKRIMALRNDPFVAGLMAGEMIKRDRAVIEARIGRGLTTAELYLPHFLGSASAGKLLEMSADNPDSSASKAFGKAARANRTIFNGKVDGKKSRALTVGEVHEKLSGMIDARLDRYQAVAGVVGEDDGFDPEHDGDTILDARLRLKDTAPPMIGASSTL